MILNSQRDPSKQIEGIYLVATEEGPRAEKETCFLFYLVPPPRTSFTLTMLPPLTKGRMKLLRDKESNLCDCNLLIQRKGHFQEFQHLLFGYQGHCITNRGPDVSAIGSDLDRSVDFPNPASFEGSQPASIRPSGRILEDR